ncbi:MULTISPECIES: TetR/AcrR family transcriptional regulator [unclassified Frankia]|uniref:TetR/AcrR family transcriptional regulator n=1 Tax=unclassified Frankia TaxID=2632575 RepID=UPI00272DE9F8|nr:MULTISPECIES: TetR/AcrR family transcriptional regulator [unclassified Frankia]
MTVSTSTGDRGRNGRRGSYDRGRITRDALIAAAERLFAERGLDAVSLREIAAAAGSHNTGAAQYHFGNKERLLEAIFEHRATVLNARRSVLLAQAAGASDATTRPAGTDAERRAEMVTQVTAQPTAMLQATVGAIVRPLAELVGHGQYVSFLARLQADHARDHRIRRPDNLTDTTFRQARDMLWHALPALPEPVFRRRFNLAMRMAIAALADYERAHPNEAHANAAERPATAPADHGLAVPLSAERLDDLVTDLIEAMSGMLAAPSSRLGQAPGPVDSPALPADSTATDATADRPTGR